MSPKNNEQKKPDPDKSGKKDLSKTFNEFEMDIDLRNMRFGGKNKKGPEADKKKPAGKKKPGIHDGIFDDDEPPEDRPIFTIARRLLPKRPEITTALKEISDLQVPSLTMAVILEESFRGKLPDQTADSLTAAALLAGADNASNILGKFKPETIEALIGFVDIAMPDSGDDYSYQEAPENARRVFMSMVAAELHIIHKLLKQKETLPEDQDIGKLANHIIRESRVNPAGKKDCDIALLTRMVKEYNGVAKLSGMPVFLTINADNTVSGYSRNAPKPPKPGI